MKGDGG
jgi:hypothetical protein